MDKHIQSTYIASAMCMRARVCALALVCVCACAFTCACVRVQKCVRACESARVVGKRGGHNPTPTPPLIVRGHLDLRENVKVKVE